MISYLYGHISIFIYIPLIIMIFTISS